MADTNVISLKDNKKFAKRMERIEARKRVQESLANLQVLNEELQVMLAQLQELMSKTRRKP